MYRIARKLPQVLLTRASPSTRVVRNLAAVKKPGMSWRVQVAASTTALTVSLVGTTLVVANNNEEFRAILEGVPGAADVLDTILGGKGKAVEGVKQIDVVSVEAVDQQVSGQDLVINETNVVETEEVKASEDVIHSEAEPDIPQEAVTVIEEVPITVGKLDVEIADESTKEEGEQLAIESTIHETESEVVQENIEPPNDGAKDIPELTVIETDSSKEVVTEETTGKIETDVKEEKEVSKDEVISETPIDKEKLTYEVVTDKPNEVATEVSTVEAVTQDEVENEGGSNDVIREDKVEETISEEVVTKVPMEEVIPEVLIDNDGKEEMADEVLTEIVTDSDESSKKISADETTSSAPIDDVVTELKIEDEKVIDEVLTDAETEELLPSAPKDEVTNKLPSDEVISSAPIDKVAAEVKVEEDAVKEDIKEGRSDEIITVTLTSENSLNDTVQESKPDIPEIAESNEELKENIAVAEENSPEAPSETEKSDAPISSIAEAGAAMAAVLITGADIVTDIILSENQENETFVEPLVPKVEESVPDTKESVIEGQIEPETPIEQIQEVIIPEKAGDIIAESADKVITENSKVDIPSIELPKETVTEDLTAEENLTVEEVPVKEEPESIAIISEEKVVEEIIIDKAQTTTEEIVPEIVEEKLTEEQDNVLEKEIIPDIEVRNVPEELVSKELIVEKIDVETVAEKEDAPLEIVTEVNVPDIESDRTASKLDEAFDKLGVKVDEPEEPIAIEDDLIEHSVLLKKSSLEIENKNDKVEKGDDPPPLVIRAVASKEDDIESGLPTFVDKVINPDIQLSLMNGAAPDVNGVSDHAHVEEVEVAILNEEAKSGEDHEQIKKEEVESPEEPTVIEAPTEIADSLGELSTEEAKESLAIDTDTIQEEMKEVKEESVEEKTTQEELKEEKATIVEEIPIVIDEKDVTKEPTQENITVEVPITEEPVEAKEDSIADKPLEELAVEDLADSLGELSTEESNESSAIDTDTIQEEMKEVKEESVEEKTTQEEPNEEKATIVEEIPIVTDEKDVTKEPTQEDITVEVPITEEPVEAKEDSIADKPLEELAVEELVAVVQDTTQELDNLQETLIEEMEKTAGLAMKVLKLQEDIVKQQKIDREKYTKELELQKQEMLEDIRKKTEELLVQKEAVEHMYVEELEVMKSAYEDTLTKKEEEYQTKFVEKDEKYQKNLERQKEELENMMKKHIGRQAAAHHEHLEEQLQTLKTEQERHHSRTLTTSLASAQTAYETSLAGLQGRLDGIEASLKERGNADTEVVVAQRLWLACRDLVDAVSGGEGKLPAWEQGVQTVGDHIINVQAVKEGDEFVAAVVSSLPSAVQARGVYSEAALKYRFNRVEKAASRVALVGEHGGTPIQHLVSALTSMLMVNTVDHHEAEYVATEMSQMELIWRARYCVDNGDMGMAVQYMNQLKGDAALVARDWVEETRMLLETQLAASALMSYATSVAMEILPDAE